jgi:hypothetical protein
MDETWNITMTGKVADVEGAKPLLNRFVENLQSNDLTVTNHQIYRSVDDPQMIAFIITGGGDLDNARTYVGDFVAELRGQGFTVDYASAVEGGKVREDLGLLTGGH